MSAVLTGMLPGAGGVGISYLVEGPEDAPWLILSNSLATDRRMWEPQIDVLHASRRVLRYDTRGHGQSEAGRAPYNFDQLTGDVLALCDALSIERADFLGLSLGGMTGLALAMRAPEKVRRLVCCDARARAPEPYKAMWDSNIARLHEVGMAGLVETTLGRWFTEPFLDAPEHTETLESVRSMIRDTSPVGYEGVARLLQSLDLQDGLATLRPATLYVTGDADMAAPVAVMQDMADRTPGASLTVVSNAAHMSNIEQPEAFTNAIKGFLSL
jgi:3-oxoadipate enol-lactonase